jgi:hypothetical protein
MDTPILVAPSPPDLNKIAKGQEIQVCLENMKINHFKKINTPEPPKYFHVPC